LASKQQSERVQRRFATPTGKETEMAILTRRSVLRSSLALGTAGPLPLPHITKPEATTIE
jgi:hypothetical protein